MTIVLFIYSLICFGNKQKISLFEPQTAQLHQKKHWQTIVITVIAGFVND